MAVQKINLKQDVTLNIVGEHGVIYSPSFENIPVLDNGYTLLLDEGLSSEVSYQVGNGLTLVPSTNSIVWYLDTSGLEKKRYEGCLVSDTKIANAYLKINIILDLQ